MSDIFGSRLYRTPYLVIPRLALEAMPLQWQQRFEALMQEADDAGIKTPSYLVFRDLSDGNPEGIKGCKQVNRGKWDQEPFYRLTGGWWPDPWADYRRGNAMALSQRLAGLTDLIKRIADTPNWRDTYPDGPDTMDGDYRITPADVRACRAALASSEGRDDG